MKKFILLCLSLFLVLATVASATVTRSPSSLDFGTVAVNTVTDGTAKKTVTFTTDSTAAVTVTNSASLTLTLSGSTTTVTGTVSPTTAPVPAGSTGTAVEYTLTVPKGTAAGSYTGTLSFTTSGDNGADPKNPTLTVPITVTVSTTHNVEVDGGQVLISLTYKNLRDDTAEINITGKEFTVKNTGAFTETVSLSTSSLVTGVKNVSFTDTAGVALGSFTLAAGASKTVKLSATLPVAFDSGTSEFGKVVVTFSGTSTTTGSLKVDVEPMLTVTDLDVEVGEEEDRGVENGDTIDEDAAPDDKIVMTFDVENLFDGDYDDGDIDDVEITVKIDDDDFGDDVKERSKEFSVKAGDEKKGIEVSFTVPDDADEATYDVNITVEGKDDTNSKNKHRFTMKVKLEVNLESDDVRVTSIDLSPVALQCTRDATMSIRVRNHGSSDQDEVRLQVDNDALGIDQDFEFELDESGEDDDEARRSFSFSVPQAQAAGLYPIDVRVFVEGDDLQDEEHVNLKVDACGATAAEEEEEPETTVVVQPPTPPTGGDAGGITGGAVFETVEVPFTQSPAFLALLVLGNVVVIGVIIFLAVKFAK